METNVVSLKDIQEVYKDGLELTGDLTSYARSNTKAESYFLDEDIEVKILKTLGPFTTLEILGRSNSRFIMPTNKVIRKVLPNAIDGYRPVLDIHFPNRWWLSASDKLYMYYPVLEISNSMGCKHTIYDLVIEISCDLRTGRLTGLCGKRYSFSQEELNVGYVHSHLDIWSGGEDNDGNVTLSFNNFCTGGGSKFEALLHTMQKRNSAKELDLFLTQLTEYLQWESLEGNPYIGMRTIGEGVRNNGYSLDVNDEIHHKMALFVLDILINNPEASRVLAKHKNTYILDPSLDSKWFFDNIEQPIINNIQELSSTLMDWDAKVQEYISDKDDADNRDLPELTELDTDIIKKFGIKPRIIEQPVIERVPAIKRLSTNIVHNMILRVNKYLNNGILTPKEIDESRDIIATQGESSN